MYSCLAERYNIIGGFNTHIHAMGPANFLENIAAVLGMGNILVPAGAFVLWASQATNYVVVTLDI